MKRWHSLGRDWLAALLLAAGCVSLVHTDCYAQAGVSHAATALSGMAANHAGEHAQPFDPCDAHHVLDACVVVARQSAVHDLPANHCESPLPAPPVERVRPCLHEPTWPTDSGSALRAVPDRAPPRA
ncbi:MAG: hypothetical protein HZB16_03260 [Armatimonadetes bacterium]|nr:hypothetical protein [Armatimonadota bacterium]